jgi:hypothetical protein
LKTLCFQGLFLALNTVKICTVLIEPATSSEPDVQRLVDSVDIWRRHFRKESARHGVPLCAQCTSQLLPPFSAKARGHSAPIAPALPR